MSSCEGEACLVPRWASTKGATLCYAYRGTSMRPTFRRGDLLFATGPEAKQQLRRGEVIVFTGKEHANTIVHRVIGFHGDRVITRGDSVASARIEEIEASRILGRVESYERAGRARQVRGSALGPALGQLYRHLVSARRWWHRTSQPLYDRLGRSRLVRHWVWTLAGVDNLVFARFSGGRAGTVLVIWHGRTVARLSEDGVRLWARRPFDLFFRGPTETGSLETIENDPLAGGDRHPPA